MSAVNSQKHLPDVGQSDVIESLSLSPDTVSRFMGVPLKQGAGGLLTPSLDTFKNYVITEDDARILRNTAIALALNQPLLIESGSGIGKTTSIDYICAQTKQDRYLVNCREMPAEMIIGKLTAKEGTKSGFGWQDGLMLQAIRNGGVLILDEYNKLVGDTRGSVAPVIDSIIRGLPTITLADNHGEIVKIHADFRLVAYQNPPGGDFSDREVLDIADFTRWVYIKEKSEMSKEMKLSRALGISKYEVPEDLPYTEPLSHEAVKSLKGYPEIITKYVEFYEGLEGAVKQGVIGEDALQPVYFAFQRDLNRVLSYVGRFYDATNPDPEQLNKVFQDALKYYFENKFESQEDRESISNLSRLVRYEPEEIKTKRRGLSTGLETDSVSERGESKVSTDFSAVKKLMGANFISPESYKKHFGISVPVTKPLPKDIIKILKEPCVIEPGKKVKDTHLLYYLPKKLGKDDFTIIKLREIATKRGEKLKHDTEFCKRDWYDSEAFANTPNSEDSWVLIPKSDMPDSRNKNYAEQEALLSDHKFRNYRTSKALELTAALIMNDLENKQRSYSNFYGYCGDLAGASSSLRVFVGYFFAYGLRVAGNDGTYRFGNHGRALSRKF